MPRLVIACARPGLIRGGVRHPKVAEHFADAFTPDQLRELLAEPELAVVIGRPLTLHDVVDIEAGVGMRRLLDDDERRELFEMGYEAALNEIPTGAAEAASDGAATEGAAPPHAPQGTADPEAGAAADTAAPAAKDTAAPAAKGKKGGKR